MTKTSVVSSDESKQCVVMIISPTTNQVHAVLPALPGIHKKIVVSQQRVEKDNSTVQLRKNVSLVVPPVKQLFVTMMESVAGKRAVSVLTV